MPHSGPEEFRGNERFRVLRVLGRGGMGVVFEAVDRERDARVALKTLHSLEPSLLFRLKNEFRTLHDLTHPNLVRLGELIESDGRWFFTMELVEGSHFLSWVRPAPERPPGDASDDAPTASSEAGAFAPASEQSHSRGTAAEPPELAVPALPPLDEGRLRAALAQLARGVAALHAADRVHRDLKSSNVIVSHDGRLVVIDLGLASHIHDGLQSLHSVEGHAIGTIATMAPEQAAGQPVGPPADWYSVGVMAYQALAGRLPYDGAGIQVILDKQRFQPRAPSEIDPGVPADLDRLCVELLRFDPATRPVGREILARLGAAPARGTRVAAPASDSASALHATPFVGRGRELGALALAFEESRRGQPVAVLIEGESGLGKSQLMAQFVQQRTRSDPSVVVLAGRCYERESVPYKAFDGVVDSLARFLLKVAGEEAAAYLPRNAALLAEVFPVLRRVKAFAGATRTPAAHAGMDPQERRARLFGALRELFSRIADRHPLLVTIDDLQWADDDSLAIGAEILRPPEAPACLLIATRRSETEAAPSARPDPMARFRGTMRVLALGPLDPAEALELAERLIASLPEPDRPPSAAIVRESGGHPFLIDEMVRYALLHRSRVGKLTLEAVLLARVEELPREARAVLEAVAVAGAPIAQEVVARAVSLTGEPFARAVAELRAARLLRTGGARAGTLEAYHDRVREAVAGRLDSEPRRACHRELALALEASGNAEPERLAVHWRGAGDPEREAGYTLRAAREAAAGLAAGHAAELFRSVLALGAADAPDRRAIERELGDALAAAGRGAQSAEAYLAAAKGAAPAAALDLRRLAAQQLFMAGHLNEGVAAIRTVLSSEGMRYPETRAATVAAVLWSAAKVRLRGLKFRPRTESDVPARDLARIDVCWHAAIGFSMTDSFRFRAFHYRGLLLALRAGEPLRLARCLTMEGGQVGLGGGPAAARAERILAVAEELARSVADPGALGTMLNMRTILHLVNGRFRHALDLCDRTVEHIRERCRGMPYELAAAQVHGLRALQFLGEFAELKRRTPLALHDCSTRSDLFGATTLRVAIVPFLRLLDDDPARVHADVASSIGLWSASGYHLQHYYGVIWQASAYLYTGDARVAQVIAEHEPRLRRTLMPLLIQFIRIQLIDLRARAALLLARHDAVARSAQLAAAEREARRIARERMPWSDPLARTIEGLAAHARGNEQAAAARFTEAVAGFDAAGMALHAAAARLRLGEVRGGAAGSALAADARRWMAERGVRDPTRMTDMLAPRASE